jgi:hypothetical protein
MAVLADGFRRLQEVLNLGEIGVGVAVIDESVEVVACFPDALLAAVE